MRDSRRTVGDRHGVTFIATAAYPYVHRDRATMGLRAALRHQAAVASTELNWSTLVVEGPAEIPGAHGRSWFQWRATVQAD